MLYANYYQLQICIHRQFIPSPRRRVKNLSLPSMTICVNAARACIRVLEAHCRKVLASPSVASCTFTPLEMPFFTVGTILGVYLWCEPRDAQTALKDMVICLDILRGFEE